MKSPVQMIFKNELEGSLLRPSRRQFIAGAASAGLIIGGQRAAFGQARVTITGGDVAPMQIAIPNFNAGTGADNEVSVGVSQVITNNLKRSGLFAPIDPAAFVEKAVNIDAP